MFNLDTQLKQLYFLLTKDLLTKIKWYFVTSKENMSFLHKAISKVPVMVQHLLPFFSHKMIDLNITR